MKNQGNHYGMGELPDPQKAMEFFIQEERDWNLVQQASDNGDKFAFHAIRIFRLIESVIDKLWKKHMDIASLQDQSTQQIREKECFEITEIIGHLTKMRVEVLYVDYRVQDKRHQIMNETRRRLTAMPAGFSFSAN